MTEQSSASVTGAKKAILDALGNRSKKARFMTEVSAAVRRFHIGKDDMERALADLQAEGTVIVRDNFCADPHLADVDLRVAALVDRASGTDAQTAALHEIDQAWNKWLGEYLANHRCG
jgi:hypothetical protein